MLAGSMGAVLRWCYYKNYAHTIGLKDVKIKVAACLHLDCK